MDRPDQGHSQSPSPALLAPPPAEQRVQRHGGSGVHRDAAEVPLSRRERCDRIIQSEAQPLHRPVEVRARRVEEEELPKPLWDQTPGANQRIAQYQRGVIPDKAVAERGPVNEKRRRYDQQNGSETLEEFG